MNGQAIDIVQWTVGIAAVLGALATLITATTRGSIGRRDSEAARVAAQWTRLDEANNDLRADNERLRKQLTECFDEVSRLRKAADDAWAEANRRRGKRGEGG